MTSHNTNVIFEVWWKGLTVTHAPEHLARQFDLPSNIARNLVATDFLWTQTSSFTKPFNFQCEMSISTSHNKAFNYSGCILLQV